MLYSFILPLALLFVILMPLSIFAFFFKQFITGHVYDAFFFDKQGNLRMNIMFGRRYRPDEIEKVVFSYHHRDFFRTFGRMRIFEKSSKRSHFYLFTASPYTRKWSLTNTKEEVLLAMEVMANELEAHGISCEIDARYREPLYKYRP